MKFFHFSLILFIIILASCAKEKKEVPPSRSGSIVQDTVIATLNHVSTFLPASPFRIDSVVVAKNKNLKFYNNTDYSATFIIPNWNKLFQADMGYDSITDKESGVQYLFIPVRSSKHSHPFKISENANQDSVSSAVYPYSIFCLNGTYAAEMNSSPIIIVEP